jgi:hypothetical protein
MTFCKERKGSHGVFPSRASAPCRDDRDLAIFRQAIFGQFSASEAVLARLAAPTFMKLAVKASESPTSAQKHVIVDGTIAVLTIPGG